MTKVVSLRLPKALVGVLDQYTARSRMPVADFVGLILEYSLTGTFNFAILPDVYPLDAKLDIRLPESLVLRIHEISKKHGEPVSVYSRVVLFAYHQKRLILVKIGGRYTLAENHEQKKSA